MCRPRTLRPAHSPPSPAWPACQPTYSVKSPDRLAQFSGLRANRLAPLSFGEGPGVRFAECAAYTNLRTAIRPVGLRHQLVVETIQQPDAVVAQAGVHGRCLHHRAARGREPAEPLVNGQLADGTARGTALADALESPQPLGQLFEVEAGGEGLQASGGQLVAGLQEVQGAAVHDDAHVEELLALDARHYAQHGVLKYVLGGHLALPEQRWTKPPGGLPETGRRRPAARRARLGWVRQPASRRAPGPLWPQ